MFNEQSARTAFIIMVIATNNTLSIVIGVVLHALMPMLIKTGTTLLWTNFSMANGRRIIGLIKMWVSPVTRGGKMDLTDDVFVPFISKFFNCLF